MTETLWIMGLGGLVVAGIVAVAWYNPIDRVRGWYRQLASSSAATLPVVWDANEKPTPDPSLWR